MRKTILIVMAMVVLALGALPVLALAGSSDTSYSAQGDHNKQVKQGAKKDNSGNQANSGAAKSPTPANAEYKKPKNCKPFVKKIAKLQKKLKSAKNAKVKKHLQTKIQQFEQKLKACQKK